MVLFWNLFLHGSVFYVNCMEIASPIGEFGLASTCGTGLASLTGDLTMHGTRQFDWRVALGGAFFQARVAGMCSRRRVGCSEHQLVALASCALIQPLAMARSSTLIRHSSSTFVVRFKNCPIFKIVCYPIFIIAEPFVLQVSLQGMKFVIKCVWHEIKFYEVIFFYDGKKFECEVFIIIFLIKLYFF